MEIDLTEGTAGWILLEKLRWPDGLPICPHCKTKARTDRKHYLMKTQQTSTGKQSHRRVWRCWNCRKSFSALLGTVLEGTMVPPSKIFLALYLVSRPGSISGRKLALELDVNAHTGVRLKRILMAEVFNSVK